jgi:cytochrome c peroxidase
MHNGVFRTLEEVVDFYDAGGGQGRGLKLLNQTLPPDSLKLSVREKKDIIAFLASLDEQLPEIITPVKMPQSKNKALNNRKSGGEY